MKDYVSYEVNRLYKNMASPRSYYVDYALAHRKGLRLLLKGTDKEMLIPADEVRSRMMQTNSRVFKTKYTESGQKYNYQHEVICTHLKKEEYMLIDYMWVSS